LSPSPAGPGLGNKAGITRFGSSHQMGIGPLGSTPYGPSREAHGPGIHNPNQGPRGHVFASRGSRGSLSTANRVSAGGMGGGPSLQPSNPMRSVSGSLTTMKEDPEGDLRPNNLMFGHTQMATGREMSGLGNISPLPSSLTAANRLQNQTPISMLPSSLSSLAPSPPPMSMSLIQQNGNKILEQLELVDAPMTGLQLHKSSVNTLASQSTLSFNTSNVAVNAPTVNSGAVVRRNHTASGNPNGMSNRSDHVTSNNGLAASQRISVFEPYPMQDAVKHFCDKHLDKIKAYVERLTARLPLPVKCTIEERRSKKHAKVHFTCQGKSEYCLYSKTLFALKTRHPRLWIHLMFLALQVRRIEVGNI
jgi:hypothetical protein